jgi:hypothetical protein
MTDPAEERPRASGEETRDALAGVLRDQAERAARQRAEERVVKRSPLPARVAAILLLPLTLWIWIHPPAFLRPAPIAPPPRIVEAGRNMDLYLAALQVNDYLEVNGHLPTTLNDALEEGDDAGDVVYQTLSAARYRLSVTRGGVVTTYESTDDLSALIRQARPVLGGNQ